MTNIFEAKFSTGQVVEAAGVSAPNLQTWLRRGLIIGHRDHPIEMPGSPGYRRNFEFFNVMEIAVAKALIDLGVDLGDAFRAGAMFAHTGDEERMPSVPFNGPVFTLLFVAGDCSTEIAWTPGEDALSKARSELGRPDGFTVLEVNPVFDRAAVALGYHPEAIIEAAYGRAN